MMLAGSEARRRAGTTGGGGTAASVVSASTTTASSSLTSAFASLSPQDIAFFDHLILHSLPRTASDFASLKQVYDHSGSPDSPIRWDTLLRLVHVRGRTWAERWEAVRLALGLSPHSSSEESESSTSTTTDRRRQGSSYNRNHIHDQHSQSAGSNADSDSSSSHQQQQHRTPTAQLSSRQRTLQALTARAGSLAQGARAAATASAIGSPVSRSTVNTPRPTRPTPLTKQATVADAPTDSDSEDDLFASDGQPPRGAARIAELSRSRSTSGKAVLADLIRAIQSISMDQSNTSSPSHSQPQVATRSPLTSTRQVDMLTSRMAPTTTRQRREPPSLRASHAELSFSREYEHLSHASSPTLLPPSSPATATAATAAAAAPSTPRSRQPLSQATHRPQQSQQQQLKQHIATVVQRARAERDRIRHSASPSSAHARLLLSPAEADAETPEDPVLVQAATQFHARTLALKAFSWWITLTRRSHARTAHITRIRNDLLLRRALAHWIHRALYTREIEERAVQIDQIRVLVGAWNTWLDQVRVRVEDKKESERSRLRAAFSLIVERRMGRSKRHFLDRWKRACQTRLADSVRKEHLLRGALALWTLAASKMAALHLAEQDWEQGWGAHQKRQGWKMWRLKVLERQEWERRKTERRRIELEDAFNYWKRAAALNSMSHILERHRLLQSAFTAWLRAHSIATSQTRAQSIAIRAHTRLLKRHALRTWSARLAQICAREEVALQVRVGAEMAALRERLSQWRARERELLWERVQDMKSMRTTFDWWTSRTYEVQHRFDVEEGAVRAMVTRRTLHTYFAHLRSQFVLHSALGSAARTWARKSRLKNGMRKWVANWKGKRDGLEEAADLDSRVLEKGALDKWRSRLGERRYAHFISASEARLLHTAWAAWAHALQQRRSRRLDELTAERFDSRNLTRKMVRKWEQRVIEIRQELYEVGRAAEQKADEKRLSKGWRKWKAALIRHGEMYGLVVVVEEVKQQQRLARAFNVWFERAYDSLDRKEKHDIVVRGRERRLLKGAWDAWIDRHVDSELRGLEYQAVLLRKQAVLRRAFTRWKQSTQVLPAISFNLAKLKLRTLERWLEAVPRARNERLARQWEREIVLPQFWDTWVSAAKIERNLRAAERFGGISMRKFKSVSGRTRMPAGGTSHTSPPSQHNQPHQHPRFTLPATKVAEAGATVTQAPTPSAGPLQDLIRRYQQLRTSQGIQNQSSNRQDEQSSAIGRPLSPGGSASSSARRRGLAVLRHDEEE